MRLGKRLIHIAMVLLCLATLGIAIATAFGMTQLFWIGWGMFGASLIMWLIAFLGIDAASSGMTTDEIAAAESSQARHIGVGAIALILALIFMLCCTVIRGVWKYTDKNDVKIHSITTEELNVDNINAEKVNATEVNATKVNATEAHVTKVYVTEANVTKVNATEVNATEVNATRVNATELHVTEAHIDKAYIDKGYIGSILGNLFGGDSSDNGGGEEYTTAKREEPTTRRPEPTTKKPEPTTKEPEPTTKEPEPTTKKPEPTTERPTEPTTVLKPSLKFEADKMSGGAPLMNSTSDKVYIIIEDCSINDINYYWCNPDTGLNTKEGISFVKVSDGKYRMVVEDWVFENSLDVAIKNPATKNQYYVVKIQPAYE